MKVLSLRTLSLLFAGMFLLMLAGCGGSNSAGIITAPSPSPTPTASPSPSPGVIPQFDHVAVVLLENANYSDVIGNTVAMPYLNTLVTSSSLASNYFANFHPSIGNYFMLTTGTEVTSDDNFSGTVSVDNLVREMALSGVSWKSYQEDIPSAGYLGDSTALYMKRHNPFAYFTDVVNDSTQAAKIVPYTQLALDQQANQLPNLIFISPNAIHDAHDCPSGMSSCTINDKLTSSDQWMQVNVSALLADANFSTNGLLVIVFDEASDSDSTHGGGRVACVLAGAHVKPGFTSTTLYQHQSLLRLIGEALHVGTIPGAGATAPSMAEFFQ